MMKRNAPTQAQIFQPASRTTRLVVTSFAPVIHAFGSSPSQILIFRDLFPSVRFRNPWLPAASVTLMLRLNSPCRTKVWLTLMERSPVALGLNGPVLLDPSPQVNV